MFSKKSIEKYENLIFIVLLGIPMLTYLFFSVDLYEKFIIGFVVGIVWGIVYALFFKFIKLWNTVIHILVSPFAGVFLVALVLDTYTVKVYFMSVMITLGMIWTFIKNKVEGSGNN